ncbi:hypothetical protein [Streptomyces ambofaciens]
MVRAGASDYRRGDPEALGRLHGAGATTVSLAQDGPDALEQALTDAVSATPPGFALDCLWGPH